MIDELSKDNPDAAYFTFKDMKATLEKALNCSDLNEFRDPINLYTYKKLENKNKIVTEEIKDSGEVIAIMRLIYIKLPIFLKG